MGNSLVKSNKQRRRKVLITALNNGETAFTAFRKASELAGIKDPNPANIAKFYGVSEFQASIVQRGGASIVTIVESLRQ